MSFPLMSRRSLLVGAAALVAAGWAAAPLLATEPALHVLKDPDCSCCTAWVDTLKAAGLEATVEVIPLETLHRFKRDGGITPDLASCHTAQVDGYLIEGHVPAADIRRLLAERPDAIGLSVPGMPYGSPGMGPESEREAYDVVLIRRDGTVERFAHYPAA